MLKKPPLALYVHFPWCVKKCPYCDFNSHPLNINNLNLTNNSPLCSVTNKDDLYDLYIKALIEDLKTSLKYIDYRKLISIYLGGGTPTLCPPKALEMLFDFISNNLTIEANAEITIEANPASTLKNNLSTLKSLGINRVSLGIQSLNENFLKILGRVHDRKTALMAIEVVSSLFSNFNLDLMHSLPKQTLTDALTDLKEVLSFSPPHLSWYELTLEPDSFFGKNPPLNLLSDDAKETILMQGNELLLQSGYAHYEVSAYALANHKAVHNSNYWRYGDYLAIGAGAHSKVTTDFNIIRTYRTSNPYSYLDEVLNHKPFLHSNKVCKEDLPFDFFVNKLRIYEAFNLREYSAYTGDDFAPILEKLKTFAKEELLTIDKDLTITLTERGKLFINHMLKEFL